MIPSGLATVTVYSGGVPYHLKQKFIVRDNAAQTVSNSIDPPTEAEDEGFENGEPKLSPESNDWEYPMYVETALQDFCNPDMNSVTSTGAGPLHIASSFGSYLFISFH